MLPVKPHELFAHRVAEAYVLHLVSINRRPVYRYSSGDIEVDRTFLMTLLDGYLADRRDESWRFRFYLRLLDDSNTKDARVVFSGGRIPKLSKRGIRYMNAFIHEFGDMLVDIGGRDEEGMMTMPKSEDEHLSI